MVPIKASQAGVSDAHYFNKDQNFTAHPPAILVAISPGAVMTYQLEICDVDGRITTLTPVWIPFDSFTGLTGSQTATVNAAVGGIRLNVTSYTSGTATLAIGE